LHQCQKSTGRKRLEIQQVAELGHSAFCVTPIFFASASLSEQSIHDIPLDINGHLIQTAWRVTLGELIVKTNEFHIVKGQKMGKTQG
jgi:hypothetical protein